MRCLATLAVLIAASGSAAAQKAKKPPAEPALEEGAEALSLADVFKVAVRVAPALEHAGFAEAQAAASLTAAQGVEDFTILATADFSQDKGGSVDTLTQGPLNKNKGVTLSLKRQLPTNGSLELLANAGDTRGTVRTVKGAVKLRWIQPLLKGFGPAAQDRVIGVARHRRNAATIRRESAARNFAASLVESYWRLALAWRQLEVRRVALTLTQKQQAYVEGAVRTGKLARSELLPVLTAIAGREQDIVTAELEIVARSVELRKLAGLELSAERLIVRTAELPALDGGEIPLGPSVELAIAESTDLAAAIEDAKGGEAQLDGSRRDLLPRLDLRLEGGPQSSEALPEDSWKEFKNGEGYTFAANLTFELPIGRRQAKGTYELDRINLANLKHEVEELRTNTAADAAVTVYRARAARKTAELGLVAVKLAEDTLDAEQKKFEVQKSTASEVVRRQDELETARLREAASVVEYLVARAQLEAATGAILTTYGLKITGAPGEDHAHDGPHDDAAGRAPGATHDH